MCPGASDLAPDGTGSSRNPQTRGRDREAPVTASDVPLPMTFRACRSIGEARTRGFGRVGTEEAMLKLTLLAAAITTQELLKIHIPTWNGSVLPTSSSHHSTRALFTTVLQLLGVIFTRSPTVNLVGPASTLW